jgi:hypothetical protein
MGAFTERVWRPAEGLPKGEPRLRRLFEDWLEWVGDETSAGGCGLLAFSVELDDQPGALRERLKDQQLLWHRTLTSEFAATRQPPVSRERAAQAAFELKSIVLGYNHSRRLLEDEQARAMARSAFEALLARQA